MKVARPGFGRRGERGAVAGIAVMFTFLYGDQISLFVAVGKAKWNFDTALGTLVLPMVALVVLQPKTPEDVAVVWGAQCILFSTPLLAWLVLKQLRRSPLWLAAKIAPGLAATAAMAVVVLILQQSLTLSPVGRVVVSVLGGGAAFIGVAWVALGGRLPPALMRAALVRPG